MSADDPQPPPARPPAAPRRPGPAWLRWTGRACFALLVLELALQLVRPTILERVRELTFPVAKRDASYITLQRHNFDGPDHRPMLRLDPELFWSLIPDQRGSWFGTDEVVVNDAGLRSPTLGPRAADELRLLFLGDSITFGMGVDASERFSEVLVDELSRRYPLQRWSLINAGCVGYSSWQGVNWLRVHGEALQVDAIVACFGINDVMLRPLTDEAFQQLFDHPQTRLRLGLRELQLVAAAEAGVGLLRRALDDEPRALHRYLWYPRQPGGRAPVPREASGRVPASLLASFTQVVPVTLVVPDSWHGHPSAEVLDPAYAERLDARGRSWVELVEGPAGPLATLDDLHLVDLRGTLSGADDPGPLFDDWCHPSAAGHARYAAALLDAWEAAGVIERLLAGQARR